MHFNSLIPKMSMFTLCHLLFDHFQFTLIHVPNIPGSYAILFFTASDFTAIISHINNWVLFSLWLCLFILSGFISPLVSILGILGTYWPGEFIFQCLIFLPFHTVHGVLKARIWKWFVIPFSSGPHTTGGVNNNISVLGMVKYMSLGIDFTNYWKLKKKVNVYMQTFIGEYFKTFRCSLWMNICSEYHAKLFLY